MANEPADAKQTGIVTEQGQDATSTATETSVGSQAENIVVDGVHLPDGVATETNIIAEKDITTVEKTPTIDELFGVPVRETKEVKTETPVETKTETQTAVTTDTEKEALLAKILEYESKQTALTEFEKDGYGFVAKNFPAFTIDSFNPDRYVIDKITEEFGARDADGNTVPFMPDANKALIPGTPDYAYAQALDKYKREAQNILDTAHTSVNTAKEEGQKILNLSKEAVMKKYGMTVDTFNQDIWSKLENIPTNKALELMADGLMLQKKIDAITVNTKNGLDKTQFPGVTEVGAIGVGQISKEDAVIQELFGTDALKKLQELRT